MGKDSSGNGNYWTTNNLALTNSVIDTPLNNFATLNPLNRQLTGINNKGNLRVATTVNTNVFRVATFPVEHNAYFEITATANARFWLLWGQTIDDWANWLNSSSSYFLLNSGGAPTSVNTTISQSLVPSWANWDIISFIWNATDKTLTVLKNNSQISVITVTNSSANPSLLVANSTSSLTTDISVNFWQWWQSGLTYYPDAGGKFKFQPPSGFKALSTANLPDPTIKNPKLFFDVLTYTGNHPSSQTLTWLSFSPDLVWIKGRDYADFHTLYDTVRWATKSVSSEQTTTEVTRSNALTAFTSNGFSLGSDTVVNYWGHPLVAWNWKKWTTPGFDIVSYTGSSSNTTIAHGLNAAPKMIIVKWRTNLSASTMQWDVWHTSLAWTELIVLNSTGAKYTQTNVWNSTAPWINTFSLWNAAAVNYLNDNYIAYLWSEVPGFSKFGSYTGNGSTDGPFVYTEFRPRYIMVKRTDVAYGWMIFDTERDKFNLSWLSLYPHWNNAEGDNRPWGDWDILSNGFKIRFGPNYSYNTSGWTYIYAAFAEAPFKYANAR
ncbi:MAG: hypothetical protein ACD_71C00012G0004 [uncultured bacterium (gcode 4)]|uniref:DUF7483 domain-containing protein n=1 Tax=uncultured bacterium (gcode 4) TaxID=1234023 RepID=K1Z6B8_9BACT|nr:MAG: hypothetical protein ACD_71C00012G0004 [uncultured bacterium (gcode 4)]